MIDLVLVNPNSRQQSYQGLAALAAVEPPLWCRLIAGYVRDRNFSVRIVDAEAEGLSAEETVVKVTFHRPRLVAIVAHGHQPSASTQQMAGAREFAKAYRRTGTPAPTIIVGGHVAALPDRTLVEEPVDFACNSDGCETIAGLLRRLVPEEIAGLVYAPAEGAFPKQNPHAALPPMVELHGNVWDLLPMHLYRAHNWQCFGGHDREPYASIHTSLGCPYKCSFCCINAPFGDNRYRMRNPLAVVEEVEMLWDEHGISTFKIVDEMFVLNERHYVSIAEGLANLGLDLNIWAYARVDTVKAENLALLRRAGVRWLALGIESGSAHVRDGAMKVFKNDDIAGVVRAIQGAGINVIGNYIFGLPDDDEESMLATLDLALELRTEFANFYSAMAYPGSKLYDAAVAAGAALPTTWSGYAQHAPDCTPLGTRRLPPAEVLRFRDEAFRLYFTDRRYLDMVERKFGLRTRQEIVEMAGQKLPRWLLGSEAA